MAIFLLGLSAGMLIERSRQPAAVAVQPSDAMTMAMTTPPSATAPKSDPIPGTVDPGTSSTSPKPLASGAPVSAFMDELIDISCDKLVRCGNIPRSMCASLLEDFRNPDADDKVKAGTCDFNTSAANRCLRRIAKIDCTNPGSTLADPTEIARLLTGPLMSCRGSIRCR